MAGVVVSQTPLRLPLGGGGTDLPAYYTKHEGFVLTSAIDKFVYVFLHKWLETGLKIVYSKTEVVENIDDIQHGIVRESLRNTRISGGIEIIHAADVPSNTGLGSSSSFAVGLLNSLGTYLNTGKTPGELAENAYRIEREILGEAGGKQDQYAAAYGGIIALHIDKLGKVTVERVKLQEKCVQELEEKLLFLYTGIRRSSIRIQEEQSTSIERGGGNVSDGLHNIKKIGLQIRDHLEKGELDEFGRLLHSHWLEKRRTSSVVSTEMIDKWYQRAIDEGASGGKLIGAGGGGFMMFYCKNGGIKERIARALEKEGLLNVEIGLEAEGTRISLNNIR